MKYTSETCRKASEIINNKFARSAWDKGVKVYALELLDDIDQLIADGYATEGDLSDYAALEAHALNGARDWSQYSWGGSALIYDGDIAKRLCTVSELKKTLNGELRPNAREEWLDTQARALYQAFIMVKTSIRAAIAE